MLTNSELNSFNIQLAEHSSQGKFGKVYLAKCLITNKKLTIKEISHPSQIEFLSQGGHQQLVNLNHPSLPKTERLIWHGSNKAYIVREYCEGIDLKQIINTSQYYKKYSQNDFIKLFLQLLEALEYLHSQNIIHQDIKPSNIIVHQDKNTNTIHATLIDLEQGKSSNITTNNKTPFALLYSPPEQLLNAKNLINERADIFALGITLYEALTRKKPFECQDPEFAMNLQLTYPLMNSSNLDEDLFQILKRATFKASFPKPPALLTQVEIENILILGINERYLTAREMYIDLNNWLLRRPTCKPKPFWHFYFF